MASSFFSTFNNEIRTFTKVLEKYLSDENYAQLLQGVYRKKATLIADYLNEILEKKIGDKAQFAINNLGGQVEAIIKTSTERTKENLETDIDTLLSFLGQVAQELFLREQISIGKAAIALLEYFFYSEERTHEEKYMGLFFTGKLPLLIYNDIITSQKDGIASKLSDVELKVDNLNKQFTELDKAENEVNRLATELKEQKVSFNFLGLSAAFSQFYKDKRFYLWQSLAMMLVIGIILIAIPFYSLFRIMSLSDNQNNLVDIRDKITAITKNIAKPNQQQLEALKGININLEKLLKQGESTTIRHYAFFALPVLAVELLLLYYFRILLQSYTNARSQIMQLQLRNSVCQFIEPYVKFRKDNKEVESGFDKFEALVFSGLVPSDDKVPSTFDGLEQLVKLIKSAKGQE